MCALPHTVVANFTIFVHRGLEQRQREPVLRSAGAQHGNQPCRWRLARYRGSGRVPFGAVVGARAAHFLAARRPHDRPGGRNPGTRQPGLGGERRDSQLQPPFTSTTAKSVELLAFAVSELASNGGRHTRGRRGWRPFVFHEGWVPVLSRGRGRPTSPLSDSSPRAKNLPLPVVPIRNS